MFDLYFRVRILADTEPQARDLDERLTDELRGYEQVVSIHACRPIEVTENVDA